MTDSNLPTVPDLIVHDWAAFADSRDVATFFRKQHKAVLRAIRDLGCSPEFRRCNFAPFKIKDLTGEATSHVEMTKDGFAFLAMGFTGVTAAPFKEAYIAKFNEMERALREKADADVFALPGGEPLTRQMLRADLSSAFKHYVPQIVAHMPSAQHAGAVSSQSLGFALGVALDGEFPRFAGSVKKILSNPENWRAAGILPLPAPTDENTFITSTEVCWQVVADEQMHPKLPSAVATMVLQHARDQKWPQGATDRRSRSHNAMPTYPLSRVKDWLAAGAADAIRSKNDRLCHEAAMSAQGVIPFPARRESEAE